MEHTVSFASWKVISRVFSVLGLGLLAGCNLRFAEAPQTGLAPTALQYVVQQLPTLPGAGEANITDISSNGAVIVGESNAGLLHAVKWDSTGKITDLGTAGGAYSHAQAVNQDGAVIVGWARDAAEIPLPAAWQPDIFPLAGLGGSSAQVRDVSADGAKRVGTALDTLEAPKAVTWDILGSVTALTNLTGVQASHAVATSADGSTVVGWAKLSNAYENAMLWNAAGAVKGLRALGGKESHALNVSGDGSTIIGDAQNLAGDWHGARWSADGVITDLAPLAGGAFSKANAVTNDGGLIVGWARDGAGWARAVSWNSAGQPTALKSGPGPESVATDVSADGAKIVGAVDDALGGPVPALWQNGALLILPTPNNAYGRATHVSADGAVIAGWIADSNGNSQPVRWTLQNVQQPQTISFAAIGNKTLSTAPLNLVATASSGLPVAFSAQTASVCSVSGSTLQLLSAGTCTLTASQSGNVDYYAAPPVSQSFLVTLPKVQVPYLIDFTTAPAFKAISAVKLGFGVSSPSGLSPDAIGVFARKPGQTKNVAVVATTFKDLRISIDGTSGKVYSGGGTIGFNFTNFESGSVTLTSFSLRQVNNTSSYAYLFDKNNVRIKSIRLPSAGSTTPVTVTVNTSNVAKMQLKLTGTGRLDNVSFQAN